MARTHYWQYLADGNGVPIEGARIYVYLARTVDLAHLSITETSAVTNAAITPILTDSNGYFHFFMLDTAESEVYGYEPSQRFKVVWVKNGITPGAVDDIEIFDIQNDQFFEIANNFSEVLSPSAARENLQIDTDFYKISNNLSEVVDPTTARANLGLTAIYLEKANNLSDIPSTASACYNIGADEKYLHRDNNLEDLSDKTAARANLGITALYLEQANNLSDVPNPSTARTNLGIPDNYLQRGNDLSDLNNPTVARINLGIGSASARDIGTDIGEIAAFEDDGYGFPTYPTNDGRNITNIQVGNITGLGNSATRNVGTSATQVAVGNHTHTEPYILTHFFSGKMNLGQIVYRHNFSDIGAAFPEYLTFSTFTCETTAASAAEFFLYKNSEGIGTVTFWTSGSDPTSAGIWFPNEVSFEYGDVFKIVAPSAAADPTLADIAFTIRGTRV